MTGGTMRQAANFAKRTKSSDSKYALVTGSSRGIGRGIAIKLAEKGIRVAVNYLNNEAAANDTLAQIQKAGSDGIIIRADVSSPEDISRMAAAVRDHFGALDIS